MSTPPWLRALQSRPVLEQQLIEQAAASFAGKGRRYFIRKVLVDLDVRSTPTRKLAPPSITEDGLEAFRTEFGRDLLKRRLDECVQGIRELRKATPPTAARCGRCGQPATTKAPDPYTDAPLDVCAKCSSVMAKEAAPAPTLDDQRR